jgi:hypothetical protein
MDAGQEIDWHLCCRKSAPAVALSADGSIVMIGGSNDNGGVGATWVFMRSGGYWTQDKNLVTRI